MMFSEIAKNKVLPETRRGLAKELGLDRGCYRARSNGVSLEVGAFFVQLGVRLFVRKRYLSYGAIFRVWVSQG